MQKERNDFCTAFKPSEKVRKMLNKKKRKSMESAARKLRDAHW